MNSALPCTPQCVTAEGQGDTGLDMGVGSAVCVAPNGYHYWWLKVKSKNLNLLIKQICVSNDYYSTI